MLISFFFFSQQISPLNDVEHTALKVPVSQLTSLDSDNATSAQHADVKFYLDYDFNRAENTHFHHDQLYSFFSGNYLYFAM